MGDCGKLERALADQTSRSLRGFWEKRQTCEPAIDMLALWKENEE